MDTDHGCMEVLEGRIVGNKHGCTKISEGHMGDIEHDRTKIVESCTVDTKVWPYRWFLGGCMV